ncbi:hypothetical protein PV08_11870 [Exophiala spinifera]|uniref:4-hydroxy-4-methyl-2-oxoglutarate aldolase n=1 Tax=Exophiala spinifera TaxID=91928 RepID=A0A0D2ATB9_9EURO|nr:uncharacterized protein PV08_11870 [Exophiala spinifera]KIW09770.1 hypothetical protein PV08_11870 [Exophiala spinifera]
MGRSASEIIQELQAFGSCDVADGLSKIKHPYGGYLEGLVMYSPKLQEGDTKIIGQAFTVKFVPKSDKQAPSISGHYIDKVPANQVLFMSQPEPHLNAVFGGLMGLRAQALGAAGVVVDGMIRDLGEHRALGMPVFGRAVGTTAANEVCRVSEVNVPVKLNTSKQDVTISPGDFIVADLNGIVCLPRELADAVLDVIPGKVATDNKCADGIRNGRSVEDVFKEFR